VPPGRGSEEGRQVLVRLPPPPLGDHAYRVAQVQLQPRLVLQRVRRRVQLPRLEERVHAPEDHPLRLPVDRHLVYSRAPRTIQDFLFGKSYLD
jgi:hypothetical protein